MEPAVASEYEDIAGGMIAARRSATRVIPIGGRQPPACTDAAPSWSTRSSSTALVAVTVPSVRTLTRRCATRERPRPTDSAAPKRGNRIGSAIRIRSHQRRRFLGLPAIAAGVWAFGSVSVLREATYWQELCRERLPLGAFDHFG